MSMSFRIVAEGTLPSGLAWGRTQDGEIWIQGTNAAGHFEWMVPCWACLCEEDQDELASLGAEIV